MLRTIYSRAIILFVLSQLGCVLLHAQSVNSPTHPTLTFPNCDTAYPLRIVAYGDQRYADPSITKGTNPRVRKWLSARVAEEKPQLLFLTGDTPFIGSQAADWQDFQNETAPWRAAKILILPTIGNHEIRDNPEKGISNYLNNFPEIERHRFYSALCGPVEVISLDMTSYLGKASDQSRWFISQLDHIPAQVQFLFILFHMPWMADKQSQMVANLPTHGTLLLRDLLDEHIAKVKPKVIVVNGHIHNYERFERRGVEYIVTGGGGAEPYPIFLRGDEDLYKESGFPVYNYVTMDIQNGKLTATLWKVKDPDADSLTVEAKDHFTLTAPTTK